MYSISHYLAQLLDISSFDDIVSNGVQVEGRREIRRIACAVTASLYAIDEASKNEADILLVHHGLFFKNSLSGLQGLLRQRIAHLLQSGIHLLAYHLPLDAHVEFGNAWPQARLFGMTDLHPFGECNGKMIGVRGKMANPLSGKELYKKLQSHWGTQGIYLGNDDTKEVRTCAFVSGQGHKFLQEALDVGVDCFINGDLLTKGRGISSESQGFSSWLLGIIQRRKQGFSFWDNILLSAMGSSRSLSRNRTPFSCWNKGSLILRPF